MAERANPIDVEKVLTNTHFPASKNELINYVKHEHVSDQIISALEKIPDRQYQNPAEAARETFYSEEDLPRGLDSCDD